MPEFTSAPQHTALTYASDLASSWKIKHTHANYPHKNMDTDLVCKRLLAELGKTNVGNQACAHTRNNS